MIAKAWNVRDQTEEALKALLEKQYRDIEQSYKLLKKVSDITDARKLIDQIWSKKKFCNEIELELLRRSWNNGTTS